MAKHDHPYWLASEPVQEAATIKARAMALLRDITALLSDKEVPDKLRKELDDVRAEMKRTWADLASEAPVVAKEDAMNEAEQAFTAMMTEYGFEDEDVPFIPDAYTLADVLNAKQAEHLREKVMGLTGAFYAVASNIMHGQDAPSDKGRAMMALAQEFALALGQLDMSEEVATVEAEAIAETEVEAVADEPIQGGEPIEATEAKPAPTILLEGAIMSQKLAERGTIIEATDMADGSNRRGPLRIRTALIRAGGGNKRDNHYYGQDVLEAAAPKFVNAKMFLTDHREDEKSVRTEASFVERVIGYDEQEGLLADVVAYDPEFCEKTRNLRDAGKLDMLHCSIYASGTAAKGKVDGADYNVVRSIDEVYSVDWVTQAGAGGHAVEARNLTEMEMRMDKEKVLEIVGQTRLPQAIKDDLTEREWADEEALQAGIAKKTTMVAELVGRVGDNGATQKQEPKVMTAEQRDAAILGANDRWLSGKR